MRKFTRKIAIAILAVLCVPATALALTTANDNYKAKAATAIEGGTATEAVTGEVTLSSFAMQDGAAIRKDTPTGIRFLTDINGSDLAKLPANAKFGTLIMPQTVLGENELTRETANVQDVKAKIWYEQKNITEPAEEGAEPTVVDTLNTFTGVLVGTSAINDFPVAYYNEPIVARSYVTYTDSEENVYTVYATNSQTRSVAYVASAALEDGESDDQNVMKNIVDTVIGDAFRVRADKSILFLGDEAYQLTVTGNKGLVVSYTTSNKDVVTVSEDGKVTAVAAGEASVTATLGTKSFTFTFRVTAPVKQDTDWNIVSEENLTNGMVNFYTNDKSAWSSGVTNGTHQTVTIDILSETNAVGNRTSGLYYKIDPVANFAQDQRFVLLPSKEKSFYEALVENGSTKNSYLRFDVYWTIIGEHAHSNRLYSLNGQSGNKQAVDNTWYTFEIPVNTLLANWELLHTGTPNSKNIAIFSLGGSYTANGVTDGQEINFWIGNFEVVYAPDYDILATSQDQSWNTVHPNNLTDGSVHWMCNNADGWMNGVSTSGVSNVTVTAASAKLPIGGKTEGAFYKVRPSNLAWCEQQNGFVLRPSQDVSVYSAYSENAVLRFDYYFEFDTIYEKPTTMPFIVHGQSVNTQATEKNWYTIEIPISTLVENYDALKTTSSGVAWNKTYLININGNYIKNDGASISNYWTAYIGNFRIVDPDANS